MPSGTIRCAKCSPTIPTLPGRSATTILSFCADLRKWRNWASTRKRQCLVGIVIRAESRRVFAVHTSRMQVGVFTCRGHQPMLERRPFGAVGVASFLRHYEQAHLLSNIEKLPLPILGSMFPFWSPTGVFLQSVAHVEKDKPSLFVAFPSIHVLRRQPRRRARGPRAPLARSTWAQSHGIRLKVVAKT